MILRCQYDHCVNAGGDPSSETAQQGQNSSPLDGAPPRSVGFTVSTTGFAIARRFREKLSPLGLEPRDFALLRTVQMTPGVSQQALADHMGVAPSRMVAYLDSLEGRGLLERRPNPGDRRARALFLTLDGDQVVERAFEVAVEHERELCRELAPGEREQLFALLARVGVTLGIPPGVHPGMGHSAMHDE